MTNDDDDFDFTDDDDGDLGLAHRNAPETSKESAATGGYRQQSADVLKIITQHGPITDMDIHARYCALPGRSKTLITSTHARRNNLMDRDLVGDTGERATNPKSGRRVALWGLTKNIPEAQRRVNRYKRTNHRDAMEFSHQRIDGDSNRIEFQAAWLAEDWTTLDEFYPAFLPYASTAR